MTRDSTSSGLLGSPTYVRFISSVTVSSVGDGILIVALPLIARTVTTSSRSIAAILAVSRLPVLLLSFGGAALADRSEARRTMVVSDLVRGAVLLALAVGALNGSLSLAAIYVTAFVLGLFEVPFAAAAQRLIPATVEDRLLPRANARLGSAQISGEQFVGPAVGGQLMALGAAAPVLGDAASFLLSAALLRGLPDIPPVNSSEARTSIGEEIREGLRWFRGHRALRTATALIAGIAFTQAIVNALIVQLGAETLRLSDRAIGYFVAAIAVGNVVGGVLADRVLQRLGYATTLVTMAAVAGIGYGLIGFTDRPVVVVLMMVMEGVVVMFGQLAFNVLRQRLIPRAMVGRVFTTTRVFTRGAAPLGALLGGEIAERQGPPAGFLVAGVLTIVLAILLGPSLGTALRGVRA